MLIQNSVSNGYKNLYLNPKPFEITFHSNSHLMSIFSGGQANPSTVTFSNISLTKTIKNLLVVSKITKKWLK